LKKGRDFNHSASLQARAGLTFRIANELFFVNMRIFHFARPDRENYLIFFRAAQKIWDAMIVKHDFHDGEI
jgi:hypothetical protein